MSILDPATTQAEPPRPTHCPVDGTRLYDGNWHPCPFGPHEEDE